MSPRKKSPKGGDTAITRLAGGGIEDLSSFLQNILIPQSEVRNQTKEERHETFE